MEKTKLNGLSSDQIESLQKKYGMNELTTQKKESFLIKIIHIICEPMFLLLLGAAIIYFILGEPRDGIVMLVFVIGMISIDVIQELKTDKTLKALKDLSSPKIMVMRDGVKTLIESRNLLPGDIMFIHEGVKIPADGKIIKYSGLCIDESLLTGESNGVWKSTEKDDIEYFRKDYCYAGTLVIQGSATILVEKIGNETEYGKIGKTISEANETNSPLQIEINKLVKTCAIIALILFLLVSFVTFLNLNSYSLTERIVQSILSGITLAMAMIPEEFPVVLTVFLSMGAWRLAKKNSLVKKIPSVETLGAVSVLCVDKTGTITKNEMFVKQVWSLDIEKKDLCEVMGLCCNEDTYDPMEKAMLNYCNSLDIPNSHLYAGVSLKEYSFTNKTKMMGHVWIHDDMFILAAKGSLESIMKLCKLTDKEKKKIDKANIKMSKEGLRVIAVARKIYKKKEDIPDNIEENELEFGGLIGLIDPPRENILEQIQICKNAGIRVVMITGDNGITASSIAKKVGMENYNNIITGDEIDSYSDEELRSIVKNVNIFSRVIPEHKMRIVNAFKENGEIVAMTGDGVNDAPALKYADIGIAMGKRGSEVSREAADLILLDDNFETIVDTIKDGRRIYDNIRKAVGYIFVIHIPIALSSLVAPLLNIPPSSLLLLPIHVVLLELIIDPTCSIVLERIMAEKDIMQRKPRDRNKSIITKKVLIKSLIQGIVVFIASFGVYYLSFNKFNLPITVARSMGLVVIILSNLFIVLVNSSDNEPVINTLPNLLKDKVMCLVNIITILGIIIILYSPLNSYLKLSPLSFKNLLIAIALAIVSVFSYDIIKIIKKQKNKSNIV